MSAKLFCIRAIQKDWRPKSKLLVKTFGLMQSCLFILILPNYGMNRHDSRRPNCPKAEPQAFVSHSDGTLFYLCKNCNYLGTIDMFTETPHVSEIAQ
jgi:hypothetical protein